MATVPAVRVGRVVVVGSLNVDLVVRVPNLPAEGETVIARADDELLGGKGSNQAVAAARLGRPVAFVGLVGDDPAGARARSELAREGVETAHLGTVEAATGRALVLVDDVAANSIVVLSGANALLDARRVEGARPAIEEAAVVVAQLEVPLDAVTAAARLTRGTFVLNAAPARRIPANLLRLVDVLVVNEVEYAEVVGRPLDADPGRLATVLVEAGLPALVVTLGARGALVWDGHVVTAVAAPTVVVVDTTGAGDAFVGALADALARGEDLPIAAQWAVHAGALAVRGRGATTAMPTAAAVRAALADAAVPVASEQEGARP